MTCNFIKKRLQHKCFPVNIAKFLRTPILTNICERRFLYRWALISKFTFVPFPQIVEQLSKSIFSKNITLHPPCKKASKVMWDQILIKDQTKEHICTQVSSWERTINIRFGYTSLTTKFILFLKPPNFKLSINQILPNDTFEMSTGLIVISA